MKQLLVTAAALAAIPLITSVASAETRSLSGFDKISASAGTRVEVAVGPAFRVDVEGPDAARIVTRVSNGTLIVEPERSRGWFRSHRRDAVVRVAMPQVRGLDASSGADITANGVQAADMSLDASSGASIDVAGSCGSFRADASSGADIDARALRCETGSVDVSSGATAHVYASSRLNVDASSGGDVLAYGDPGIGDISLSSGGSLHRR